MPRILSWVLLSERDGGDQWLVANTHFDHRGREARRQSGRLIATFLAEKTRELQESSGIEVPVLLLGDFNCMADSDPYRAIVAGQLVDARVKSRTQPKGPASTWCGFREIAPDRVIDHLFVRGPVEVLELETHNPKTDAGRFASDHLPVRAKVRSASSKP